MKATCIYHADCIDGAAAAAVVRHKYPDCELLPAIHGEATPKHLKGKCVFIVDFSFSAEILRKMAAEAAALHWYDHHKTAIPIQEELGFGIIDLDESGATLTWKQLFPDQAVPKLLQYVRDKDIWRWELPDSRDINMALKEEEWILDPSHSYWKNYFQGVSEEEWKVLIDHGSYSRILLKHRIEKAVKKGFGISLGGHKALAVNWTEDSSEMGEYIYRELGYPVALIFSYAGTHWSFSLRSSTVDVSEIAITYGGGGHAGAAGFRSDKIEWLFKLVS